jgi:spermidine/putrescine transport system permease protein
LLQPRTLLAAPSIVLTIALLAVPVVVLVCYSFWQVDGYVITATWNTDNYAEVIRRYDRVLLNTFSVGLEVGFFTSLAALPVAYAIRFKMGRAQNTVLFLLLTALFSGYLVRIYAWRIILGDHGILNNVLLWIGLTHEPLQIFLYNRFSLIVTQMGFLLPLAVLPIYSALQNLPKERLDASHDLGAGRLETFWRVVMPEIAIATGIAFSLCMALSSGDFLTPTLVGGPNGFLVGQAIARQFGTAFDWPLGSALAVSTGLLMILIVTLVLRSAARWQTRLARSTG